MLMFCEVAAAAPAPAPAPAAAAYSRYSWPGKLGDGLLYIVCPAVQGFSIERVQLGSLGAATDHDTSILLCCSVQSLWTKFRKPRANVVVDS